MFCETVTQVFCMDCQNVELLYESFMKIVIKLFPMYVILRRVESYQNRCYVQVIAGIDVAVRSMKEGGIRRVIIPPSFGYQNTSQEPIPPNVRTFFFSRLIACLCLYTMSSEQVFSLHTLLLLDQGLHFAEKTSKNLCPNIFL